MSVGLRLADSLSGRVRLGAVVLDGVTVHASVSALDADLDRLCAELLERYGGGRSREVPGAADARSLYRAVGLDPTKTRPSNEALLRRVLRGQMPYRINALVDALNLSSLREQLPFGLYDLDQITPPVTLRLGGPGEGYEGIRKGRVNVEGRPALIDAEGPFGNPSSDSARSMVRPETSRVLVTCYAPVSCSSDRMAGVLDRTRDTLVRFCGGRETERHIF
jgi:DNA/RNA-binding domain of Phe-tRNA-synthetase-like protein